MSEIKPVTFRLDTETTDKFKELANTLGVTQDKMLQDLLATFELEKAKNSIVDRAKEIDEFQSIANRMIRIYMNSLELNQSSEERIKEKFTEQLIQKQDLITNLQEQVKKLKEDNSNKDSILSITIDDKKKLSNEVINIKNTLETKEVLIKEYVSKIDTLTSLVTEYSIFKDSIEEVKIELDAEKKSNDALIYESKDLRLENESLKRQVEMLQSTINDCKDNLKITKEEYKENINQLKVEKEKLVSDNKNYIDELLIKHEDEIKELKSSNNDTIRELKDSHKQEIESIEKKSAEKVEMEIDKVTIKYEKLLLEKVSKIKNDK